jgi:hypothetical protein
MSEHFIVIDEKKYLIFASLEEKNIPLAPPHPPFFSPCVIKFISDLWQIGGFLRVPRFPPPIKLTATI